MRRALGFAFVLAAVVVAGCGDDGRDVSAEGAAALSEQVVAARTAIATGDAARGDDLLGQIESTVTALQEADDITEARADEVRAAVDEVRTGLDAWVATSTTTTTTTTPPTTVRERDDNDERGNGDGKEKNGDD